jgi:hypothetical protein
MKSLIKSLLCLIVFGATTAFAQSSSTNSIFLEQIGDSSTISLLQKGSGNEIGNSTDFFRLNGNEQVLDFTQEGNNNSITGNILSSSVNSTILNTGNSNEIKIDMGSSASTAGTLFNLNLTGASNLFQIEQGKVSTATSATLNYNIGGDFNNFTTHIETNGVVNTINVTGDQNNFTTFQNGFDGKNIDLTLVGSGNAFNIQQKSILNVDSITINSISNNGTYTISQCGPLGC